jgi:hypothetical protein
LNKKIKEKMPLKKIFLFALFVIGLSAFSQNEQASSFNYKAKFEGVSDATKATPIINAMKMVFKTQATYNESTELIEFSSKMSISQTVFNNMMSGEGYQVESFERREVKQEAVPEAKKAAADTAKTINAKKENAKSATVPKPAPKTGT